MPSSYDLAGTRSSAEKSSATPSGKKTVQSQSPRCIAYIHPNKNESQQTTNNKKAPRLYGSNTHNCLLFSRVCLRHQIAS